MAIAWLFGQKNCKFSNKNRGMSLLWNRRKGILQLCVENHFIRLTWFSQLHLLWNNLDTQLFIYWRIHFVLKVGVSSVWLSPPDNSQKMIHPLLSAVILPFSPVLLLHSFTESWLPSPPLPWHAFIFVVHVPDSKHIWDAVTCKVASFKPERML